MPILEGRLGTVRVGLWEDDVDKSIRETLAPVIAWIALIIFGGIVAAFFLAWRINRPIVRLVRAARDISHGELDSPGSNSPILESMEKYRARLSGCARVSAPR